MFTSLTLHEAEKSAQVIRKSFLEETAQTRRPAACRALFNPHVLSFG